MSPAPIQMESTLDLWSFRGYGERYFTSVAPAIADQIPIEWTRSPLNDEVIVNWPALERVSAEGLLLLAMVTSLTMDAIKTKGLPAELSNAILAPLRMANVASGITLTTIAPGLQVLPPCIVTLSDAEDCEVHARIYADLFCSLASRRGPDLSLRESLELTLLELFTNAREHGGRGHALVSASVARGDRASVDHMAPAERAWLQAHRNRKVIEIAVGDTGPGIPAHLANNYVAAISPLTRRLNGKRSSARYNDLCRAHTAICAWAFQHYSTSKISAIPTTETLNWRGLHRALAHVTRHDGFIAISSGYARTGYAAIAGAHDQFEGPAIGVASPAPGTIITIRHILKARDARVSVAAAGDPNPHGAASRVLLESAEQPLTGVTHLITHPFEMGWLQGDRRASDLDGIRVSPPHRVDMHLLTDVTPERLGGLIAEAPKGEWSRSTGSPRLLGAWTPDDGVMWTIAGLVPHGSLAFFTSLARTGLQRIPANGLIVLAIEELQRQFPHHVRLVDDYVLLHYPDPHPVTAVKRAANAALLAYPMLPVSTYSSAAGECVLLTDNTRVRRYFSLTALIEGNDVICATLAHLLVSELDELRILHGEFSLVTTNLASYYLARRLLRVARRDDFEVHFLGSRATRHSSSVLFQTITRTGRGLRDAASRVGATPLAAVVGAIIGDTGIAHTPPLALRSLLTHPFDPGEIHPTANETLVSKVICTVSDWPVSAEPAPTLINSPYAQRIMDAVPDLYSAGLQAINGRIHSIALPGTDLVRRHQEVVIDWFVERIGVALLAHGTRHVSFVCNRESALFDLIPRIADRLFSSLKCTADRMALPSVQFTGHSAIFANARTGPLRRESLRPQATLLPEGLPPPYCVVYMDTAAVTGKTLHTAVNLVAALPSVPRAFLALVITDRLSPRDSRFLGAVNLRGSPDVESIVPFEFDCLFRLQIASYEHLDVVPAARLIRELAAMDVRQYEPTAPYISLLRSRLDELSSALAGGSHRSRAFGHLYTPDDAVALTPSPSALLFRQTLALFHQNEPVLATLRTLLHHLMDSYDTSLLAVLALEPNLLRQPPLLLDGWADIRTLANHALHDSSASVPVMSDALTILCIDTTTAVAEFHALASGVTIHPALLPQLLVLLARLVRLDERAGERLLKATDELADSAKWLRATLLPFLKARTAFHWPVTGRLSADALATIYDFAKTMFPHSPAHDCWRDADSFLTMSTPPENMAFPDLILPALKLTRDLILPAVNAASQLSRQHDELATVDALGSAKIAAYQSIEALQTLADQSDGPGDPSLQPARAAWSTLQQKLITTDPHTFLGTLRKAERREGALEAALKRMFSMPERLIADYVEHRAVTTHNPAASAPLPRDFRRLMTRDGGSWIAPVAYQATLDIAKIAIDNHLTHGVPGSLTIGVRTIDTPQGTEFHVLFTDAHSSFQSPSTGFGMSALESICHRWHLPAPKDTLADGVFRLLIRFVRCAYLIWDTERSNEILHYR